MKACNTHGNDIVYAAYIHYAQLSDSDNPRIVLRKSRILPLRRQS